MKHANSKPLALLLALLMLFTLVPSARAAEGDAAAEDVTVSPARRDGLLKFDETLTIDGGASTIAETLAARCKDATGSALSYISYVSVSATQGTLYDGYNSEGDTGAGVAGLEKYYYNNAGANYKIESIQFVPNGGFTGRALITYYGYTVDTPAKTYSGRIYVNVGKQEPGISYSTDGGAVRFSAEDFSAYSLAVTGRTFRYISFKLPSAAQGALYYNYLDEAIYDSEADVANRFFRSSAPFLDNVSFVPRKGYSGTFPLAFTGLDTGGAALSGEVNITVTGYGPGHTVIESGPFVYPVASGRSVTLSAGDFEDQTQSETGSAFRDFRFASLPAAASGTLYANDRGSDGYAVVNKRYTSPEDIRFAASSGYTGTVTVPIICFGTNGRWYDAALRFVVTEPDEAGEAPLRYTVEPGKRVYFLTDAFSDACFAATGYDVSRVHFDSLPNASQGMLYYDGADPVSTESRSYYYKEDLSDLSFLASGDFTGTVTVPFTGYAVGYSGANGRAFSGTITIVSTVAADDAKPVIGGNPNSLAYTTTGRAASLEGSGILSAAAAALPGAPSAIRITAPAEDAGRLYMDFRSPVEHTAFDARRSYPVSDVSRISYLPKAGYSGSFTLDYTISDAKGNSYTGNLRFSVTPPARSYYFSDMGGRGWAVPAVEFLTSYGAVKGTARGVFSPDTPMKRGDFVLMLSRVFSFPNAGVRSFSDVPETSYYAAAIAGAKAAGVLGDGTRFDPQGTITREEAAVLLYRCLNRSMAVSAGSAADLSAFSDSGSVSADAVPAMGALARLGVFFGSNGRLYPKSTLSRAQMATILYRALTA